MEDHPPITVFGLGRMGAQIDRIEAAHLLDHAPARRRRRFPVWQVADHQELVISSRWCIMGSSTA